MTHRLRPQTLIAAGLFGMALYSIATRAGHLPFLQGDAIHGALLGTCIGLQLLGVGLLRASRLRR